MGGKVLGATTCRQELSFTFSRGSEGSPGKSNRGAIPFLSWHPLACFFLPWEGKTKETISDCDRHGRNLHSSWSPVLLLIEETPGLL